MTLAERVKLKTEERVELYKLEPDFPYTNFLIEISNVCNHACIFCTHQKMTRATGFIDEPLLYSILQQAYDLGTREVGFYATGEPFASPNLHEYVKKAKDIGYSYVYLTTNGSIATPEKLKAAVQAGADSIKFSINATTRESYAFIHGQDHFDTVVKNLKFLNEYRAESGKTFKIFITGILNKYNEDQEDNYSVVFKGMADEIVFKKVYNQGGTMPEIDTLLKCSFDNEVYRRCNLPFDSMTVTKEGYLTACNADFQNYMVVADLNKVSLKDGWYSDKMKELRQKFIDDKLEGTLCDGCVHHEVRKATPLMPEYATVNEDIFSDTLVRNRIAKLDNK